MTDTPIAPPTFPPPSKLDQIKAFVGDLARPFAIIATSLSAAVVPVIVVVRVAPDRLDLIAAAAFIGAIYAGVGGIFWGKAWENAKTGKQAADVEIAKAAAPTAP